MKSRKVTFFTIIGVVGLLSLFTNCGTNSNPVTNEEDVVGTYYWENSISNIETFVKINSDGTWKKDIFIKGKKYTETYIDTIGTWKKVVVSNNKVKDKTEYTVIVFDNQNWNSYLFNNGCIETTNDDIISNSNYQTDFNGEGVFGYSNTPTCKENKEQ